MLIVRVHPEILARAGIAGGIARRTKNSGKTGIAPFSDLEKHLYRNGTRVVKFFLHLSKEEQRRRFLERIDDPEKNWKFSQADIAERKFWKDYMQAYEDCLSATSTGHAPWFVVPADDKENARLIISQIILDTLEIVEDELSQNQQGAPQGIAGHPQIARQIKHPP